MKTMFFGVAAAMLLIGGAAQADTAVPAAPAFAPTFALAQPPAAVLPARPLQATNPLWPDNPTGLHAYVLRRDGLLINGLLPAPGWQG